MREKTNVPMMHVSYLTYVDICTYANIEENSSTLISYSDILNV